MDDRDSRCICGVRREMSVTDITIIQRDVGSTEDGTTFTATVGITLNGRNTIEETRTVFLTDNHMRLARDISGIRTSYRTAMQAYTTAPATAINVTCCTALDIGIGRSDERLIEVVGSNVVFIVHRTYCSCGIEILGDLTTQQGDVSCSVNIASIGYFCITQTTAVGVSTAKTAIKNITADISPLVDNHIGIVFLAVSGYCQTIGQAVVGIARTDRKVDRLRFWGRLFLFRR